MHCCEFEERLQRVTDEVLASTRARVSNALPTAYRYLLDANHPGWGSSPGGQFTGDEEAWRECTLPNGEYYGHFGIRDIVEYLWRDGKVPVYGSIIVHATGPRYTYLLLRCSPVYSSLDQYRRVWTPTTPFVTRYPAPPPAYRRPVADCDLGQSVAKLGKYDATLARVAPEALRVLPDWRAAKSITVPPVTL